MANFAKPDEFNPENGQRTSSDWNFFSKDMVLRTKNR